MRKKISIILVTLILFLLPSTCLAVSIDIEGSPVIFTESSGSPFIDSNNRTLVPLRVTMESFGATVSWDSTNRVASVTYNGNQVDCPIGAKYIIHNGKRIENDTAAIIKDSRTYLPIRAVLEAFGANISWNGQTSTVIVARNNNTAQNTFKKMTIHFIDVGQGDCTFIDYGDFECLVDAGTYSNGDKVVKYIKPYVDGEIDLVIATHNHADHVGGLSKVFKNYKIKQVIDSGSISNTDTYNYYKNALPVESIPDEDMVITLSDTASITIIEVLDNHENENNNSVVALIQNGNNKILLTGDSETDAEQILLSKVPDIDIYKAGHHGSSTSNSLSFLSRIKPEVVIFSAGLDNEYGHPHIETLSNLALLKARCYGTFRSGDIIITSNGTTYELSCLEENALSVLDAGAKSGVVVEGLNTVKNFVKENATYDNFVKVKDKAADVVDTIYQKLTQN